MGRILIGLDHTWNGYIIRDGKTVENVEFRSTATSYTYAVDHVTHQSDPTIFVETTGEVKLRENDRVFEVREGFFREYTIVRKGQLFALAGHTQWMPQRG